ncbi:granulocyte-macrophage colony-stimulating factor receptor subunit alpha isoform X1 [Ictalurus furcatus]|uniref:granulocyte-macrophage colony-stimulating factor receptor subunit alpha isoform X1 n=1 Tax=Ictalurus furcatus TaxID=66913 RepID=UPI00235055D3|nr:granulocyte-macrophage colony-stimulating factor receptor subunit alpha isoform X1 [Ictalurus furcatus]
MVLLGSEGSVVLICLSFTLVGVDSISGNLPPPENFSLSWHPRSLSVSVNWREPAGLDAKCKVNYTLAIYYEQKCPPRQNASYKLRTENLICEYPISKECEICMGITTNPMVCEEKKASKEIYKELSPPLALVKNFSCAYYANNKMNCTWTIVRYTPDLQLFYRQEKKPLKHCKSYLTSGILKTGCHLDDKDLTPHERVYFVINGTGENHLISNKFMIDIHVSAVKPPKPKVYITQEAERLHFQASTPNFLAPQCWKYKYIYNKCSEKNEVFIENSSTRVEYDPACKYTVRGQVVYTNYCGGDQNIESEMSEPEYYGEDGDPNLAFKVAMIVTPLIVCCCLIAAIVLFRRNKDIILPKIPEPSLFFKDMLNSTSDGLSKSLGGGKLYVPVKEVVASGVSLEPKSSLLHPNYDACI